MPTRPCWVEISTSSFEHNFRFLQAQSPPGSELLAIVKADAYGHSLALCAPAAVRAGAQWLGVTSVEEGVAARRFCPAPRILVMGGVFPGQESELIQHKLTPVVWEPFQLERIEAAALEAHTGPGAVAIHLEIDSGMSRQGVSSDDLDPILPRLGKQSAFRVEAVMTHLYASDESDGVATARQLAQLEQALIRIVPEAAPEWLSVGASAALLGSDAQSIAALAQRFGLKVLLRPGLALYGVAPRFEPPSGPADAPHALAEAYKSLRPVLAWKTQVVSVRDIPAGAEIGYNGTFVATEPMRIALLAVGYADGLDRRLGNRFSLLMRGQRAPLVGRISMDQAVIDVTEIPEVEAGDEVVILGSQGGQSISAFDHANVTGTIPWEVFTRIGARVSRIEV